jgi:hypothetical protein
LAQQRPALTTPPPHLPLPLPRGPRPSAPTSSRSHPRPSRSRARGNLRLGVRAISSRAHGPARLGDPPYKSSRRPSTAPPSPNPSASEPVRRRLLTLARAAVRSASPPPVRRRGDRPELRVEVRRRTASLVHALVRHLAGLPSRDPRRRGCSLCDAAPRRRPSGSLPWCSQCACRPPGELPASRGAPRRRFPCCAAAHRPPRRAARRRRRPCACAGAPGRFPASPATRRCVARRKP